MWQGLVTNVLPKNRFRDDQFHVKAGWIAHGIPSFGYLIREQDKPGTLDKEALISYGVKPGDILDTLRYGGFYVRVC